MSNRVPGDAAVHRVGGGSISNLALKPLERALVPPGISTLWGGTPAEAAETMRQQYQRLAPRGQTVVGTTTAERIRAAGFDVIMDPTKRSRNTLASFTPMEQMVSLKKTWSNWPDASRIQLDYERAPPHDRKDLLPSLARWPCPRPRPSPAGPRWVGGRPFLRSAGLCRGPRSIRSSRPTRKGPNYPSLGRRGRCD